MERDEVARIAREKLGVSARLATGEYGMLARLLRPGEEIVAMVLAQPAQAWLLASGVLLVATDRRLLLVSKAMVSRRERVEEFTPEHVRSARLESPMRIVLTLHEGERAFSMAQPASQVAALAAHAAGRRSRFAELDQLARRKLGRVIGSAQELSLIVLDGDLEEDEAVLDMAWSAKSPARLVVVCPDRVILVPEQPLRSLRPAEHIAYADVLGVEADGGTLIVQTRGGSRRLEDLLPLGAPGIVADRIAARLASGDHRSA